MGQSVLSSLKLSEYEWSKIDGIGEKYSARTGHECVAHLGKLYVFAGTDDVVSKIYLSYIYIVTQERSI